MVSTTKSSPSFSQVALRSAALLLLLWIALSIVGVLVSRALPTRAFLIYATQDARTTVQQAQLFVIDHDRNITEPLLTIPSAGTPVQWSSNGRYIAFEARVMTEGRQIDYGQTRFGIYVLELRTGRQTLVRTTGNPVMSLGEYTWAPDARQLAYRWFDRWLAGHIDVVNVDGSDVRRITHEGEDSQDAAWSPDGQSIAYVNHAVGHDFALPRLYVTRLNDDQADLLFSDADNIHSPIWSPDGQRIAFLAINAGMESLHTVEIDGGSPQLLLENVDFTTGFAWSPDGGQIVYGARGPDSTDLYVIDWNGSRPVNLTNNPGGGYANQEYRSLVWSPDGKQIAFLSNYPMQPGVYLINADGTGLRRVIGDFDSAYVGLSWWNPS